MFPLRHIEVAAKSGDASTEDLGALPALWRIRRTKHAHLELDQHYLQNHTPQKSHNSCRFSSATLFRHMFLQSEQDKLLKVADTVPHTTVFIARPRYILESSQVASQ